MKESSRNSVSILTPFQQRLFLAIWTAQLVSNIGTWMQSTAAAWMMTGLDPSPVMVALVQTAASLPIFFLGLFAGAIADVTDRRRFIIFTQIWMLVSAAILAILTIDGLTTPFSLLLLTFSLGIGSALMMPGFQAIFPDIVPRPQLPTAVTLNSVSYNIARCVGPALGGLIVALAGPGPVFFLNAISFLGVVFVLLLWTPQEKPDHIPPENIVSAMRTGIRYFWHARDLKCVLIWTAVFTFFGSAVWALMPLVAFNLGVGAWGYGTLIGALGMGSLIGAGILSRVRSSLSLKTLVTGAEIIFAAATVVLGFEYSFPLLMIAMIAGGIAWITIVSNFNATVQTVVPSWVQARALGLYWMIFSGGMAISSYFWGVIADFTSVSTALLIAGIGLLITLPLIVRLPLRDGVSLDMSPARYWSESRFAPEPKSHSGPVFVTRKYRIDPCHEDEFLADMRHVERLIRRDGAVDWRLVRDLKDPSLFIEVFVTESWADHLRQHERLTVEDLEIEQKARIWQTKETSPAVRHFVSAYNYEPEQKTDQDI